MSIYLLYRVRYKLASINKQQPIVSQDMSEQRTFTVEPIKEADINGVMKLLKKTFYLDEPLNAAIGLCSSETDPCPELDEYCMGALLEGLSFKAVDAQGKIVGATISGEIPLKQDENGNDLLSQAQRCPNSKFQKILYIIARREEGARLRERYAKDQRLVEVKVAATDPEWRRRGVMNELMKHTEEATKQRGIRLLRMDTSSAYSAKSAERQGFTCVYKANYKEIKMDGQPLIVPEPPHVYDKVYIKVLPSLI